VKWLFAGFQWLGRQWSGAEFRGVSSNTPIETPLTWPEIFRRTADNALTVFARTTDNSLTVFRNTDMSTLVERDTIAQDVGETIIACFDFSQFPEAIGGGTLTINAIPTVTGLTFVGSPILTTTVFGGVPIGLGILQLVQITDPTTVNTTFNLVCYGNFNGGPGSGGSTRAVRGAIFAQ
jgi:hypothetical protein